MANKNNEHIPDEGLKAAVIMMAAYRVPNYKIAAFVGITVPTLLKHYQHQLDNAETMVDAEVLLAWMKLIKRCDPLTVNRYMERKFKLGDDLSGVATELPSVRVIDNIPRTLQAALSPPITVPEDGQ